jgi:hypothetical protein
LLFAEKFKENRKLLFTLVGTVLSRPEINFFGLLSAPWKLNFKISQAESGVEGRTEKYLIYF